MVNIAEADALHCAPLEQRRSMTTKRQGRVMYPRIRLAYFNKLINLVMSRQFQEHGLDITREQEAILRELSQQDGCNQAELAQRTGQDRNNLSRTLDILAVKNLVLREPSLNDKRNSIVRLTDVGRQMQRQALEAVDAYRDVLFKGFTQEEINAYAHMVVRLTANLESYVRETEIRRGSRDTP